MLSSAGAVAPQSGRMNSPIDTPLSEEAGTYLNAGDSSENGGCRFEARRTAIGYHSPHIQPACYS